MALYVVAKQGLSTALADGPLTVEQLAAATGTNADVLRRIVRALAPLGVFRTEDGLVEVTDLGATLADGQPGSVRDLGLFWWKPTTRPSVNSCTRP
ncbi:methyltransferase family protein [Streptomyces sp. CA-135486]|uniref:methyltransferase family protein n=1 Tax=Streptomyces sp. CA-135486 TaxID=3240049 RepID=UPI003D8F8330